MRLTTTELPEGVSEELGRGLRMALPRLKERAKRDIGSAAEEMGGSVTSQTPHVVYALGIRDLTENYLERARPTAIRFLVGPEGTDEARASAEVALDSGGSVRGFSHLTVGPLAPAMHNALRIASELPDGEAEFRALEVPAMYFAALWLFRPEASTLIPLEDYPPALHGLYPYGADEILKGLLMALSDRGGTEGKSGPSTDYPV